MPINLTISAETVGEFDELIARFSRSGAAAPSAIMPEIAHTEPAKEAAANVEATKPATRSRKAKDADEGKPAASAEEPAASASETAAASTAAPVDPFATAGAETVAATPAATSPADTAAAEAGDVTIQQLKDAMADLLKAKSASFAMATLEAATGCKSLTSGSPSVVEKAKEDPTIFRKTLDALVAAKTAA